MRMMERRSASVYMRRLNVPTLVRKSADGGFGDVDVDDMAYYTIWVGFGEGWSSRRRRQLRSRGRLWLSWCRGCALPHRRRNRLGRALYKVVGYMRGVVGVASIGRNSVVLIVLRSS